MNTTKHNVATVYICWFEGDGGGVYLLAWSTYVHMCKVSTSVFTVYVLKGERFEKL